MLAENIMQTNLVVAKDDELVSDVFITMREAKLRMLPVLDQDNVVVGVLSTFCVLQHIVPDYVVSGDLKQISYAPDMGILRRHYDEIAGQPIKKIMNTSPLLVNKDESLLSVAAALSAYGRHEYAMVVDKQQHLLGIISSGDILDRLQLKQHGADDA